MAGPKPMRRAKGTTTVTRPRSPAPLPRDRRSILVLELNGEWHAREVVAGATDPNSGGNVVFLSPGVRLSYDKWSGFVSVGVPVVNELNGIQAEPDWRVLTGVAVNF
jgi:hypothetical protein